MIRLVYGMRRLPDVSEEQFRCRLCDDRGPLVAQHAATLGVFKYTQSYAIYGDPFVEDFSKSRGMPGQPYDGVEQFWFYDRNVLANALASPLGNKSAEALVEDERQFVDFSRSCLFFGVEVPQINPMHEKDFVVRSTTPFFKLMVFLHGLPSLSKEESQRYWWRNHGPLVREYSQILRLQRYLHILMIEDQLEQELRAMRGTMEEAYIGMGECWQDRGDLALMNVPEMTRLNELLREDRRKFIDLPRCVSMTAKERIFVDKPLAE